MLAKKISVYRAIIFLALAVAAAGCTPAGPRAFLQGKKDLDRGDFADAALHFKTAATLLATNAEVWNYYGVALQADSQPQAAASAYQRALDLDRDLIEAHYNLGCLWLEQNQPDAARTEFTAYTLRRNNDPVGWLKLGSAQLRLGETVSAERSFSTVLALKPADPAAYNGLGLARVQRGMPRDAVSFFAAALRSQPDYPAAILNLATTSQQYLRDNKTALAYYQKYLELNPRPADWDEVNEIANQLEQPVNVASRPPAPVAPPVENAPAPQVVPAKTYYNNYNNNNQRSANEARQSVSQRSAPSEVTTYHSAPPQPVQSVPYQTIQVQPPPEIVTSPRAAANLPSKPVAHPAPTEQPAVELPMPAQPDQKSGFWHRLFGSDKSDNPPPSPYFQSGVTPLPSDGSQPGSGGSTPAPAPAATPPAPRLAPVSLSGFARYHYTSPSRPAPGNHANGTPAAADFTRAQLYEQDEKWSDAVEWYEQAAQNDPSWFVAQYNTAVLAHRLRLYSLALPSYENALAIQPDSTDARYNFALALKAAGYVPDAVNELNKVLVAAPDDARAHLALANIYAQTLHDTARARKHYLRVLELAPDSPQASDIRFWLAANPD